MLKILAAGLNDVQKCRFINNPQLRSQTISLFKKDFGKISECKSALDESIHEILNVAKTPNISQTVPITTKTTRAAQKVEETVSAAKTSQATQKLEEAVPTGKGTSSELEAFVSGKIKLIPKQTLLCQQSPEVQKAYLELEQAMIARNPAKNNDSKKLEIFANRYLRNEYYTDEYAKIGYLNDLKFLMGLRTPAGEPLLGVKFIDYITNPCANGIPKAKYEGLRNLVNAARHGYIDKCIFTEQNWFLYADGVNPKILADIKKLEEIQAKGKNPAEAFIPEVKSPLRGMKPGDMCMHSKDKRIYIMDEAGTAHELIPGASREEVYRMFIPAQRYFIAQNMSGTCYQLSAYHSILNEPTIAAYLTRMIRKTPDGKFFIKMPRNSTPNNVFSGKFPDFAADGAVQTFKGYLNSHSKDMSVRSSSLIKALESLYGSHRKYTRANEYIEWCKKSGTARKEYEYLLKNMNSTIITEDMKKYSLQEFYNYQMKQYKAGILAKEPKLYTHADDYYKEYGKPIEIFDFFLKGRCTNQVSRISKNATNQEIENLRKILGTRSAKCFRTYAKPGKTDHVMMNMDRGLAYSHAYSIIGYNRATDIVTYVNPWNTALTYDMKLTELLQYMSRIDIAKYS